MKKKKRNLKNWVVHSIFYLVVIMALFVLYNY